MQRHRRWFDNLTKPQEPISSTVYVILSLGTISLILIVWMILTYGGIAPPLFLPSPTAIIESGIDLIVNGSLRKHTQASVFVIFVGWGLASVLAVPLGILMGSYRAAEAIVEPIVNFMRYLPVSALIPLLILYIGLGVEEKIAVIFIGTFFQLTLLVADVATGVSKDLLDCAYTLGTGRVSILTKVLIPATLPGVMDNLRITMGWAWTYLVIAEIVASDRGLGYMILNAQRGLFTDRIFVGLLVIGGLGFVTDYLFKWLHRWLLPWSPRV